MGTIYLVNILHKILIYSKYTLINGTIISRPFMLIIIFEYTCNMVIDIHSKILIHPTIFLRIHKIYLCIFTGLQLNWSHLLLMGHKYFFLDENQIKCCLNVRMNIKIVAKSPNVVANN